LGSHHQQQQQYEQQSHHDNYHRLQEDEEEDADYHRQHVSSPTSDNNSNSEETKVLFVFNLTVDTTEEALMREFSNIGKVERVYIVMDKKKYINRGFGFVTMATVEDANKALATKMTLGGVKLHVERAARSEGHNSTPGQGYQGKRTPRERIMPKSQRHKEQGTGRSSSSRGNGSSGNGGGGRNSGRKPYCGGGGNGRRGGKGGRGPLGHPHHLPPSMAMQQPPYPGYYPDVYLGYPPYPGFPPGTPPHDVDGPRGVKAETRPPLQPPYSGYPPGYPPYSGYPPGYPYPYGYYPPYGYEYSGPPPPGGPRDDPRDREGASSPPPGSSAGRGNRSPQKNPNSRYYSSSNYRYNPYPSVTDGNSTSGTGTNTPHNHHHAPPATTEYDNMPSYGGPPPGSTSNNYGYPPAMDK